MLNTVSFIDHPAMQKYATESSKSMYYMIINSNCMYQVIKYKLLTALFRPHHQSSRQPVPCVIQCSQNKPPSDAFNTPAQVMMSM